MASFADVFDPRFLRKLDRLRLTVRLSLATRPGNTPMPHGTQLSGLELSRHKAYAPGDDLRHMDWNAFGRLDQLLVKLYRAEREAPLHLLLDTSASMGVPAVDHKLPFARALAASLAYISLRHQDRVRIVALGDPVSGLRVSPFFSHPQRFHEIRDFLSTLQPHGAPELDAAIDAYLRTTRLPGLAVLLSDFLVPPEAYRRGLGRLLARGYAVAALRVIGAAERDPGVLPQRVRLRDAETGRERTIALTRSHQSAYLAALEEHLAALRDWCTKRSVLFTPVDTAAGLDPCLFETLPRAGLLH